MIRRNGFTLVELLVIGGFMALLVVVTIRNFSNSRAFLNETVSIVVSDVRAVQSKAISGTQYQGVVRCGYGIERINKDSYRIYVGPRPSSDNQNQFCSSTNKNYSTNPAAASDISLEIKGLFNKKLEFKNSFSDIFFEPIDPKVYINNQSNTSNVERITIGYVGHNCSNTYRCMSICVYGSGIINKVSGAVCP